MCAEVICILILVVESLRKGVCSPKLSGLKNFNLSGHAFKYIFVVLASVRRLVHADCHRPKIVASCDEINS